MSVIFWYIVAIIATLLILRCVDQYFRAWRYIDKLPGPRALPILGNALQLGFNLEDFLNTILKWWYTYGSDKYRVWLLNKPYIVITDPKEVEVILSSQTLLEKSELYEFAKPWVGDGLLTSNAPKWNKMRKIINPSFHLKLLMNYVNIFNRCGDRFLDKLFKYADTGKSFDVRQMTSNYTLDVICESALGISLSSSEQLHSQIETSIFDLCDVLPNRAFGILKRFDFFYKFTSDYRRQQKAIDTLRHFTLEVINKPKESIKENILDENLNGDLDINIKQKKAFLDNLLTAKIDNRSLTFQEIFDEVLTFLAAGHDTANWTIAFGLYILSRFPEIQKKVFKEQMHIFGDDEERDPTYNDLQEMRYLELFIMETLRLFPTVPLLGRHTREYMNLGDLTIPPNTNIAIFILAMGRNEKYFKDPLKFDPDRFSKENRENENHFENIPFSAGPRMCVGYKFAMLEMKAILSKIVRKFEISPPYDFCCNEKTHNHDVMDKRLDPPVLSFAITLKAETEINVRINHRKY